MTSLTPLTDRTGIGRVLRTGLSSLLDRAASRFNPSRTWEEIVLVAGLGALAVYIADGHEAPDPLPIAVLACLVLIGRMKDRERR